MIVVSRQIGFCRVRETTYFFGAFIMSPNGIAGRHRFERVRVNLIGASSKSNGCVRNRHTNARRLRSRFEHEIARRLRRPAKRGKAAFRHEQLAQPLLARLRAEGRTVLANDTGTQTNADAP
jgi:hypothetical protein